MEQRIFFISIVVFLELLVLIKLILDEKNEQIRYFINTIILTIIATIISEFTLEWEKGNLVLSVWPLRILFSLLIISTIFYFNSYFLFSRSLLRVKFFYSRPFIIVLYSLIAFVVMISIIGIWTGWIFTFDENCNFSHGMFEYTFEFTYYTIIVLSVLMSVTKFVITKEKNERFSIIIVSSICLLPAISQVIDNHIRQHFNIVYQFQVAAGLIAVISGYLFIFENQQKHLKLSYSSMLKALTTDYSYVFKVNSLDGKCKNIRKDKNYKKISVIIGKSNDYNEFIDKASKYLIKKSDAGNFKNSLSIENVMKILSQQSDYTFDFKGNEEEFYKYARFRVFKLGELKDEFVFAVMDNTKERERQIKYHHDLEKALEKAKEGNKAKSLFLSNISHDIRTPMNAIVGFANIAKDSISDTEVVTDSLNKIMVSSKHLLSLLNDILDMSSIENNRFDIINVPTDLKELIHEIQELVSQDVSNKEQKFIVQYKNVHHTKLSIDNLRLKQVLLNLINNSIKFTPNNGTIKLIIKENISQISTKAQFQFIIEDNGCGMNKDFVEKMFEPFAREKSTTMSGIAGTGLGTSIVKNIVDKMGGTIKVESAINVGTKFYINLDFDIFFENDVHEKTLTKEKLEMLKNKRVLLVEDNELNREIARNILQTKGMVVTEVYDNLMAIDLIEDSDENDFDIVLMDIQTPKMNGYEATRIIRELDCPLSNIPIVAMTANSMEEDIRQSFKSGMNAHIAKPIDVEKLLSTMLFVLGY